MGFVIKLTKKCVCLVNGNKCRPLFVALLPAFLRLSFIQQLFEEKNYIKIADFEKTRLYCFSINSRSPPSTGLRMNLYENCGKGEGKMKRQCHGFRKHVREHALGES